MLNLIFTPVKFYLIIHFSFTDLFSLYKRCTLYKLAITGHTISYHLSNRNEEILNQSSRKKSYQHHSPN